MNIKASRAVVNAQNRTLAVWLPQLPSTVLTQVPSVLAQLPLTVPSRAPRRCVVLPSSVRAAHSQLLERFALSVQHRGAPKPLTPCWCIWTRGCLACPPHAPFGSRWSACVRAQRSPSDMQSLISPVTKAVLVALFIFAILLILYVILWYICRDVDCDHGI
ncbi:hypothetical protein MHYP_G00097690 [Metynnis hypsauchen]